MICITDGGSTKCDWILLDSEGTVVLKTRTLGLNPAVISPEELNKRISENKELQQYGDQIRTLDFYGAGCGTITPQTILRDVLKDCFSKAEVTVNEDTVAAVYAATDQPGIVCILGTGSNSTYFDGENIHQNIESLGYSLMDEASGNYFGKKLIIDYYYKNMPKKIASKFENEFNLEADFIKNNIYKEANPNMYLATFAKFMFDFKDEKYIKNNSCSFKCSGNIYKL